MANLEFIHRYLPSTRNNIESMTEGGNKSSSLTLLLLHGTGGNEDDLIPVGQLISPTASLLSPRGRVLENGMPRFFKRLSEGVFDIEDLKLQTQELSKFVKEASDVYSFDLDRTIAVGFSNGANIAASLLLSNPKIIKGAVLFRAMIPFVPEDILPDLVEKKILLSAGLMDPLISKDQTENLLKLLKDCGAEVTLKWQQSGHNLIEKDITDAKDWISKL